MRIRTLICLATWFLGGTALALSPPPPLPRAELEAFYHATGGDQWLHNDGWLDEDTPICSWYGITCTNDPESGYEVIGDLILRYNGLVGTFDTELLDLIDQIRFGVDLSGNQLTGPLPELPLARELILANNQLSGALPEATQTAASLLTLLDLSRNDFEGEVPESWEDLNLLELNLADNRLSGLPKAAFLALEDSPDVRRLQLENNHFSGVLPTWLIGLSLSGQNSLNLCWNNFTINNLSVENWVRSRHLGGSNLSCLSRERRLPNPELSGSWFHPPRSGEGFSLMLLDNGTALLYWFTHISRNRQKWMFQVATVDGESLIFDGMYRTEGIFNQGFGPDGGLEGTPSKLRFDWIENGILHGEYTLQYRSDDLLREDDVIVTPPPVPTFYTRLDHWPLTQLAGSRCDNTHPMQWVSGAWFDPARGGEGFVVEVNQDGLGVVYWFTHTPDDSNHADIQAWMIGEGHFQGSQLIIPDLLQPRDQDDAMPGDTNGIEVLPWGSLTIDFHDPESAELNFSSDFGEYGNGQYPLTRLARAKLAECSP